MKLTYSKKVFIFSIIVFLAVIILDVVFTDLLLGKINVINNKVRQLDLSSQERERALNLEDSVINSKIEREKLTGYFIGPGNAETVRFTEYLEDLALKAGVTHKKTLSNEPLNNLSSANMSALRFRLNISGSWKTVFSFLLAIENLPKVVYLNSVLLHANTDETQIKSGNVWSADIDFLVVKLDN